VNVPVCRCAEVSIRHFCTALLLLISGIVFSQTKHVVHGTISEFSSNEALIGATVYAPAIKSGVTTNAFGFYSLELQSTDSVNLEFSFVGFLKKSIRIKLRHDSLINIELIPVTLKEVIISGKNSGNTFLKSRPGQINLDNSTIHNTVALFGEHDVLSYLQLLPGISNSSEASNYFSVRGGGPDQNLIVLDDAPVYNSNHLFGYFSNLNEDIIKKVEVWKGAFPAKFGGKLSSAIDVRTKDGDQEKFHASFGIGLISTKFAIEGPIVKKKSSFVFAVRRSNLDFTLPLLLESLTDYSRYHFMDVNLKLNFTLNKNNRLFLSAYYGIDKFNEPQSAKTDFLKWFNTIATVRWNHIYSAKLFSNSTLLYSKYVMDKTIKESAQDSTFLRYLTQIEEIAFKNDFDWYPTQKTKIVAGIQIGNQFLKPGYFAYQGIPINNPTSSFKTYGVFSGSVYAEFNAEIAKNFNFSLGDRLTSFYIDEQTSWSNEPRISLSYQLFPGLSITSSYAKTSQPIHMLTSTGIGTPTDMWVPATSELPVEKGQQVSLGFSKEFDRFPLTFTADAYYKEMQNIIGYKPWATFLELSADPDKIIIPNWEDNVLTGKGTSYGAEFLLKKESGRLTGLISYTLAWAKQNFQEINYGNTFYAPYDSRHKVSFSANYNLTRDEKHREQISLSANWIFTSAKPITLPVAVYHLHSAGNDGEHYVDVIEFGPYNGYRVKAYHRLDLAIKFTRNKRKYKRIWELGILNAYNRLNPYKYYIEYGDKVTLQQSCYFPILPYASFSIKL